MKISIIDIGTQSIKHYIFSVEWNKKDTLYYKRYSDAHLWNDALTKIEDEAIQRNVNILTECMEINKKQNTERTILVGTQILRTAPNADMFVSQISNIFWLKINIITQDDEAKYLYKWFQNIVWSEIFGAVNIWWWSSEIVVWDKDKLINAEKIEIWVKTLRTMFVSKSWDVNRNDMEKFLDESITKPDYNIEKIFITWVLDFYLVVSEKLWFSFDKSDIANHPIVFDLEMMKKFVDKLRDTPLEKLKEIYEKDPGFADNVAIWQTLYYKVAEIYGANKIFPSRNDLTDWILADL